MTALDWGIVAAYLVVALGAGVLMARRASGSMEHFFLSGRSLPWWLAGTSMVATSFAADTPLVVTGWTRTGGLSGNWRWWSYMVGTLLAVVLFSRLWRRSGVLTDVEFMELRYSGRPARGLRVFKSLYQVVFLHCFVMGWVILGLTKVAVVLFDLGTEPVVQLGPLALTPAWLVMLCCATLAFAYSEIAGLWGVVLTDFIQFGFALLGAVLLMLSVGDAFGGLGGLMDALQQSTAVAGKLDLLPDLSGAWSAGPWEWSAEVWAFAVFVGVIWCSNKNADGSGVMVQRMLASRDERHAWLGTLWYAVAHYALRPWPWIVVALASLLVLPTVDVRAPMEGTVVSVEAGLVTLADGTGGGEIGIAVPDTGQDDWRATPVVSPGQRVAAGQVLASTDDEMAYPVMMRRFLGPGLLGLFVASFLAAFMSTIDTHLNLASAYLVHDVYRRFVRPDAPEKHYLRVARISGVAVLAGALGFAAASESVRGMFDDFTVLFGGIGIAYVLRWCWWRVNAWSEVAALLTAVVVTMVLKAWPGLLTPLLPPGLVEAGGPTFAGRLLVIFVTSLVTVIGVTLLTPPVDRDRLADFCRRVGPVGVWGAVAPGLAPGWAWWLRLLAAWAGAIAFVLGCLFVPGAVLLEASAAPWVACALGGLAALWWALPPLSRHVRGQP